MWRISARGEIFEQRYDCNFVETALVQLLPIERRYGDCRFDDIAELSELRISLQHIGVGRITFGEVWRRRDIVVDEELAAAQIGEPCECVVTHRMVDQQQIALRYS